MINYPQESMVRVTYDSYLKFRTIYFLWKEQARLLEFCKGDRYHSAGDMLTPTLLKPWDLQNFWTRKRVAFYY